MVTVLKVVSGAVFDMAFSVSEITHSPPVTELCKSVLSLQSAVVVTQAVSEEFPSSFDLTFSVLGVSLSVFDTNTACILDGSSVAKVAESVIYTLLSVFDRMSSTLQGKSHSASVVRPDCTCDLATWR